MDEITKGKKTDEFSDPPYEDESAQQSKIELEEPPTYDTAEEMIAEEKETQEEKAQQENETENCGQSEEAIPPQTNEEKTHQNKRSQSAAAAGQF